MKRGLPLAFEGELPVRYCHPFSSITEEVLVCAATECSVPHDWKKIADNGNRSQIIHRSCKVNLITPMGCFVLLLQYKHPLYTKKSPARLSGAFAEGIPSGRKRIPGNDLLSQTVTHQVPSALRGLTAVFGMGTGVSPSI